MDISYLFATAWAILWRHRFLWVFGILGGGMVLSPLSLGSTATETVQSEPRLQELLPAALYEARLSLVDQVLAQSPSGSPQMPELLALILLIGLLVTYLGLVSRAALIRGVHAFATKKRPTFRSLVAAGQRDLLRLIGLYLALAGLAFLPAILGFILVSVLTVLDLSLLALATGLALILLWLAYLLVVSLIAELSIRELILRDRLIFESIIRASEHARRHWPQALLAWIVGIGLSILVGFGVLVLVGFGGLALFPLWFVVAIINAPVLTALVSALALAGGGGLVLAGAGFGNSFVSAYWTLAANTLISAPARQR